MGTDEQLMEDLAAAEKRCIELEQLVLALLEELKEVAPYAYAIHTRARELQDRAAAYGIIPGLNWH